MRHSDLHNKHFDGKREAINKIYTNLFMKLNTKSINKVFFQHLNKIKNITEYNYRISRLHIIKNV